jgi:plastocyanin
MKKSILNQIKVPYVTIVILLTLAISGSCSKDSMSDMPGSTNNPTGTGTGPGTNEVWIQGSAFNPDKITVTAGTTITWTNKDGAVHTVTSDNGLFDSGNMAVNGTFTQKFSTAGTFLYHCKVHTTMTGTIVVN